MSKKPPTAELLGKASLLSEVYGWKGTILPLWDSARRESARPRTVDEWRFDLASVKKWLDQEMPTLDEERLLRLERAMGSGEALDEFSTREAHWRVIGRAGRGGSVTAEFVTHGFHEEDEPSPEALFPGMSPAAPRVEQYQHDVRDRVEELTGQAKQLESELERRRLESECENLKSQLIAVRRALLIETDDNQRLRAQNDGQLGCISRLTEMSRALQEVVLSRDAGKLCMHGTHSGVVTDVEGEEIVVVYETDHGPIEQIYDRTQFREGNVPNVGDDVKAHVFVTSGPMDLATRFENADLEDKEDDFAAFREKGVSGPIEI